MSIDNVKKFYAKVEADKALKSKLQSVVKDGMGAVVKIATAAGFSFTAEDLAKFRAQTGARELSDAELSQVAGGKKDTACMAVSLT